MFLLKSSSENGGLLESTALSTCMPMLCWTVCEHVPSESLSAQRTLMLAEDGTVDRLTVPAGGRAQST